MSPGPQRRRRRPPRRLSPRPATIGLVVALALVAAGPLAGVAVARDLQAHGSDERLWLARVETAPQKNAGEITTLFLREKNESNWRRLEPIGARVLSLGSRGSQLAVLLPNGDWRLTTDAGFASGRPLPDRARLIALGSGAGTLWAVGAASPAEAAAASSSSTNPTTAATRSGKTAAAQPTRPATSASATMPAAPPDAGGGELLLYRFGAQGWEPQGPLPEDVRPGDAASLSIGDAGGAPLVAYQTGKRGVRIYRYATGQPWDVVANVESPSDVQDFKLLAGTSAPVLWLRGASGPGWLWFRNAPGEPILRALTAPGEHAHAVAHANGAIRVLWVDNGKVFDQRLNSATGAAEGDPVPAPVPAVSIAPAVNFWTRLMLTAALVFAFAASIRHRREMQEIALDPGKFRLALFSTRLTAGVIDALPLLAAIALASARANRTGELETEAVLTFLVGAGAYILLTTLVEVFVGRSIGKLLTGLYVVGLDGKPAPIGARLMRNALRVIDIVAFPLALILFSPLRQRAGDLAAGTLVVRGKAEHSGEQVDEDKAEGRGQKDEG